MTEETQGMEAEQPAPVPPTREKPTKDVRGSGKWDAGTSRYIPVGGGSRTRVPGHDDPRIPRYAGMLGIDPEKSDGINTLGELYSHLGGNAITAKGTAGKFSSQIIERKAKIPIEEDEMAL